MNLFENNNKENLPLAFKIRPESLDEMYGQKKLIGKNGVLRKIIEKKKFMNSIFWGPPGTGKTTLALIIAKELDYNYFYLNAIKASVTDIKKISEQSKMNFGIDGRQTLLFLDEIHRFNKLQQDSLLQDLEDGNIVMIGATSENPYYSLNNALLSRCLAFEFKKLSETDILEMLNKTIKNEDIKIKNDILEYISFIADGDVRHAINYLELLNNIELDFSLEEVKEIIGSNKAYHKTEDKYDTISAMIKSIRGSDPDATVYWIAKMLMGGEDPLYLARRLVILASEDIGLANAQALTVAVTGMQAAKDIGMPEVRIILSEVALYLALSPKSNSAYMAIDSATMDMENIAVQDIPSHLKKVGRKDYKYPHDYSNNFVNQKYMLDKKQYYKSGDNKFENAAQDRLDMLWGKGKK